MNHLSIKKKKKEKKKKYNSIVSTKTLSSSTVFNIDNQKCFLEMFLILFFEWQRIAALAWEINALCVFLYHCSESLLASGLNQMLLDSLHCQCLDQLLHRPANTTKITSKPPEKGKQSKDHNPLTETYNKTEPKKKKKNSNLNSDSVCRDNGTTCFLGTNWLPLQKQLYAPEH